MCQTLGMKVMLSTENLFSTSLTSVQRESHHLLGSEVRNTYT